MTHNPVDFKQLLPKGSWFREYITLYPYAEPPISYILFSAMQMMGAILGRKVEMPYGVHTIRPMLNLLLIGPSGIGKSTSVKLAKALRNRVVQDRRPQFIEGGATKERLHADLVGNPHAIIFAPELATFFGKETYKEGLISYVTNLLDYEDTIELRTKKTEAVQIVHQPEVSILGASTADWLAEQLPSSAAKGGFLPRFLLVYEDGKGQHVANPHRMGTAESRAKDAKRVEDSVDAFGTLMSKAIHVGQFDYADHAAAKRFEDWYHSEDAKPQTGLLEPYAARASEMILRLALLLAVSCGADAIETEHVSCGIKLFEFVFNRLTKISAPTSAEGKTLAAILQAVPKNGSIDETTLFQVLQGSHTSRSVKAALTSLNESKMLQKHPETKLWSHVPAEAEAVSV